ncbi:hypothetical protein ACPWSR_03395 [Alloiococcus sp. CFN-8]|uniref:hypothetical protein n=1 Tax=Alloiococcus sp. CFN-8 TaxID=3416081 RepID=UPI003CF49E51
MMKKIIPLILIIIVAISTAFAVKNITGESLVTGSLSEVERMKIYGDRLFYNSETRKNDYKEYIYLDSDEKEEIEKYFNAIVAISAYSSRTEEDREKGPVAGKSFIIEILYKDGNKDIILTGEEPGYFFRKLNEKGDWIGGDNYELGEMLMDIYYESFGAKTLD